MPLRDSTVVRLFRAYAADRRGSLLPLAVLATLPVLAALGAAFDYSRGAEVKARLTGAADAAALAALRETNRSSGEDTARNVFNTTLRSDPLVASGKVVVDSLRIRITGNRSQADVDCDARVKNAFMPLLGKDWQPVSCKATARLGGSTSTDLVVLIDNSASMTQPLDPNVQPPIDPATGCAFACHMSAAGIRARGVRTQMDAGMEVFRRLVDRIDNANNVNYTIYTVSARLRLSLPTTRNKNQFYNALDAINFETSSHLGDELKKLAPDMPGHARSQNKALVILTDGLEEFRNVDFGPPEMFTQDPNGDPIWLGAPDGNGKPVPGLGFPTGILPGPTGFVNACSAIKQAGFTIYIVYVPHPESRPGNRENHQENEAASRAALTRCASPDKMLVVDNEAAIEAAAQELTKGLQGQLRLAR